jgi:hypothetical protein
MVRRQKRVDPNILERVLVSVIEIFTENKNKTKQPESGCYRGINKDWENYNKLHVIVRSRKKVYIHVYAFPFVSEIFIQNPADGS